MAVAKDLPPGDSSQVTLPPTDLYSNEPPSESDLHLRQILLLIECLEWVWRERQDFFASGNLTVYFSPRQIKSQDFRGPDFFVVKNTERRSRKSWVVWEEGGKYPNLILEVLSDSTAQSDRETKKQIYQDVFRTPEYFWFDPESLEFAGFLLVGGQYEPMVPNPKGYFWSQQLALFLGVLNKQVRFFSSEGQLVPTPQEAALAAEERAAKLAEQLRAAGIEPNV